MYNRTALLTSIMIFAFFALCMLGLLIVNQSTPCVSEPICPEGSGCLPGCCTTVNVPPARRDDEQIKDYVYPWYAQWPVLFVLGTLGSILVCCVWCLFYKRSQSGFYMCSFACCVRRPASERDSAGSVYPPPRYSRCGSFHQPPPPYSEVTSKPDLYPLVITYGDSDAKSGGNYLMVHYFRNYVIRAPGSLSAASTAESLNSSFLCNATNEANSVIPPPYSCASNYEECGAVGCGRSLLRSLSSLTEPREPRTVLARPRPVPESTTSRPHEPTIGFRENLITSPVQSLGHSYDFEMELLDCELYCDGSCKPRLGASPPALRSPSDHSESAADREPLELRHLFRCPSPECESPPQPTSPTQVSRESTLQRPPEERRSRRLEAAKKALKTRKSSLYMPLTAAYPVRTSRISPGARLSSRSAPATPCSSIVPNLLTFTQRVSASRHSSKSSRLEEEKDPLLKELETQGDHKF
ncbi:uncharacterized protein LOC101739887 isoform X1 [Bombyx mori]|uniref:WW domain binding protein VOPP1 n=1 Tax=Bombyx mori TaxID=7091 RepID=A0A8R1WJZ9_BOMMO|nr:uncharacterized protein LOC101739887 isoform X1 [Bombyx mori]